MLDAAVAACYLGLLAGWALPRIPHFHAGYGPGPPGLPAWLDWASALLMTVPIAARRRYPWAALGIVAVGTILASIGGLRPAPFPALAYVLYWVALTGPRRPAAAALILALAGVVTAFAASTSLTALSPGGSAAAVPSLLFTGLTQVAAWAIGRTVRQQRAYTGGLAEQATQRAQAEIDAARSAVTEQRLRIARDLHDVVAHSVSLMTVQAGAARMLAGSRPEEAGELLTAIETTGRDCLRETRRVVGVLRDDDLMAAAPAGANAAEGGLWSAPGLRDLPGLAARAAAGVTVTVAALGTPRDLPAAIELTAYRIIQESLTNVVRHSSADQCHVALTYGARELTVKVTNSPVGPRAPLASSHGAGYGLIGMRERVLMHEGRFSAGPTACGGFAVTATLPLSDVTA
jgi:signal transduction histidine kinase